MMKGRPPVRLTLGVAALQLQVHASFEWQTIALLSEAIYVSVAATFAAYQFTTGGQ